MKVAILTSPRAGAEYLSHTLGSAIERDPQCNPSNVRVFADALERPPGLSAAFGCSTATQAQLDSVKRNSTFGTLNYLRALEWASAGGQLLSCVLEDDLSFARRWYCIAQDLGQRALMRHSRFAITLLSFYDERAFTTTDMQTWAGAIPRTLASYNYLQGYYGSQATVYSQQAARIMLREWPTVLDRIQPLNYDEGGGWMMDLGLKRLWQDHGITALNVLPNIVQHTGVHSSICEEPRALLSPTFQD